MYLDYCGGVLYRVDFPVQLQTGTDRIGDVQQGIIYFVLTYLHCYNMSIKALQECYKCLTLFTARLSAIHLQQ